MKIILFYHSVWKSPKKSHFIKSGICNVYFWPISQMFSDDTFWPLINVMKITVARCARKILKWDFLGWFSNTVLYYRSSSPEDMQEKYIRVLSTSLLSYGLFIEQLVLLEEEGKKMKALEKAGNMHSNILKDPKFWKLAHHNNLTVRKSKILSMCRIC